MAQRVMPIYPVEGWKLYECPAEEWPTTPKLLKRGEFETRSEAEKWILMFRRKGSQLEARNSDHDHTVHICAQDPETFYWLVPIYSETPTWVVGW